MTNKAVNNARNHKQTRQRLAESRALQRVTAALLQRLSLEEVFEIVRREARAITGATGDGIYLLEEGVISSIRDAEAILIMGPGEAKVEIKRRLESEGLGGRIVGIETVDKMTDHQIAAKTRQHFAQ